MKILKKMNVYVLRNDWFISSVEEHDILGVFLKKEDAGLVMQTDYVDFSKEYNNWEYTEEGEDYLKLADREEFPDNWCEWWIEEYEVQDHV